ncbi:GntR family transcriptional regulator [Qiania dongpingensis]|uniref:GntR family transcriptional regulator n=1 Tax=Qiania dongpingensis TaxID=2763669 RepID=A0A7G9G3J0_9FIRM|nr:GntR family transcriptional regulator [Qiania dongpingensis]QNM05372.1 GntR family transcriptional regulator [Qiania dongpingensis]
MLNDQGFANLIYEYFVVRFQFQYYKKGDSLPKTESLCRQFNVSSLTIKSAFKRLHDEGYISRSHGRSAKVLFQQDEKGLSKFAVRFFSERRTAIPDLYQSTELVVVPMLTKGFLLMDDNDFTILDRLAEQPNPEDQIRFYCYILLKTKNPLVMNLFWESTLYLGLPFPIKHKGHVLYDAETSRRRLRELIACGREGDPARIYDAHLAFQRDVSKEILNYIERRLPNVPQIKPLSFCWNVYRDRPQICCSLAIRIIHDVYFGDYCGREFLPSYENLAEKYSVSVSTMRRTIGLLNQLGATQTINGKGTRILMLSETDAETALDLTAPAIRQNMNYYIQSFELLAESCERVMNFALKNFTESERMELVSLLEKSLQTGRYNISPQRIFAFTAEHSPLQALQEIYGKLYGLNLWGYPMKKYRTQMPGLDESMKKFTETIVQSLKDNDIDHFSMLFSTFMKNEYQIAKKILTEHGYKPKDMNMSPAFSLLRIDDI